MASFVPNYDLPNVCFAYFGFVSGESLEKRKRRFVIQASSYISNPHGHAGGALEFAPAYPCAFDRAQDCFPDAVTEHRTIDQAHR
jgi:hypothetical protein